MVVTFSSLLATELMAQNSYLVECLVVVKNTISLNVFFFYYFFYLLIFYLHKL